MSEKRRDNRGRILHNGESQRPAQHPGQLQRCFEHYQEGTYGRWLHRIPVSGQEREAQAEFERVMEA